jgi:hypothetical protein
MYKIIATLLFLASFANAQTKTTAKPEPGKKPLAKDTVKPAPVVEVPDVIPNEFAVYSKKPKGKDRMKLCINLVSKGTVLNYCITDSICKNPEVSKILFEKQSGDTNYVLVLVDAFSKPDDKPACDAGKETKLFFARWNTTTNKATWKQKSVGSCMRGITNMTKEKIADWDNTTPLLVNYYRGNSQFVELKFDPDNYKLGFQSASEADAK